MLREQVYTVVSLLTAARGIDKRTLIVLVWYATKPFAQRERAFCREAGCLV
jgi:hypothetical protein